jgi:hypothetical protein
MHDNYFVTLPTSQYNKSAKTDKKNKSFKQYNLLQCQSSYSPLGSFSNLPEKNNRILSETGNGSWSVKMGGEPILFLKGNGLTEVYIKVVFILFIRTINNLTTTTCPVLV